MAAESKFKLEYSQKYGRFLEAVDDVKPGELIFKDTSLIIGPKTDSAVVCLDCHKPLLQKFVCCDKCKIAPICGKLCENNEGWHKTTECEMFAKMAKKIQVPKFIECLHVVTLIRCILLRKNGNDETWNKFMDMESHIEKRRGTGIWKFHEKTSQMLYDADVIDKEDIDSEIVQKLCGILDVNSFELRSPNQTGTEMTNFICGIYPLASLMTHNCLTNTHLAIDDEYNMFVRACVPIKKGDPIFFNYTNILEGTINRREHLREGKYFECECKRCNDPSELQTNLSTMKCIKCKENTLMMKNPLNPTQLKETDIWLCKVCDSEFTGIEVKHVLNGIKESFKNLDNTNPIAVDGFINKILNDLHPNHYIIIDIKHMLAGLLRDILNRSIQQPRKLLARKIEICQEFLPLLDILEPGISRLKALALYELHIPTVQLANKDHDAKEITIKELLGKLIEAEKILKEAIRLLLYEPINTPEGKLCRRAMDELKMLQKAIENAKNAVGEEGLKQEKKNKKRNKKN